MVLPRQPAYSQIADLIRAEILAGSYEPSPDEPGRDELPGAAELGVRFGVSNKTAARAIQQLVAEGLVRARSGMRPLVVSRAERLDRWPMQGRYARARDRMGVVFGGDMQGREVTKRDAGQGGPIQAPDQVVEFLQLANDRRVIWRRREKLVDGRVAETSTSYFPLELAAGTLLARPEPLGPGGMVAALESLGHRIARTINELRARPATTDELATFGVDPTTAPLASRIMIEITHATYGEAGEPLEAVISVRPASNNVIVFETDERTDLSTAGE
jgi:DNA-binding GntR family transcriptional regulator